MSRQLEVASRAARAAGELIRENFGGEQEVDEMFEHDIKLAMDVRSQELISEIILGEFPDHAIFGEEGIAGNQESEFQWIIDPIDGTVNYFYGIPHFAVSIALRRGEDLVVGVIYDPMMDEIWEVEKGGKPRLNGREVAVSSRDSLGEAVVTVGFSKTNESMERGMERYQAIAFKVRKTRMLGSAALAMAYISCGRLDAYIEEQISLWDIAAGKLLVEAGGGVVELVERPGEEGKFSILCSNGRLSI